MHRSPLSQLLILALSLAACGDSGASAPPALRPGDSLLERPELLVVEQHSASNLPDDLPDALRGLLAARASLIPRSAWEPSEAPVRADEFRKTDRIPEGCRRWITRPPLRLDLALGDQWLTHGGQAAKPLVLPPLRKLDMTRVPHWTGARGVTHFRWHADTGELHALSPRRPQRVEYGYSSSADSPLARLETGRTERPEAPELLERFGLDRVDRPALLAPAPTSLRATFVAHGDALRVAVGVLPVGFTTRDEQLVRDDTRSDGVGFHVEIQRDTGFEELWGQHVSAEQGWVEALVDLTAYQGQTITLRLRTTSGPSGDTTGDYALWSALRLQGEPRRPPERPHVIFVDADTLRADRLGMYGADRPTSPRLDAWAARHAVVYEQGRAVANWTLPSTVSMLTGLSVTQHGVRRFPSTLTDDLEPLAVRLRSAGYETYARTDGGFVNAAFGFHHGFDVFDFNAYPHDEHQERGWSHELRRLRERRSERPVFYFLQTYMVHAPYPQDLRFADGASEYAGRYASLPMTQAHHKAVLAGTEPAMTDADWEHLRALYDAGVRRMDDVVVDFLDALPELFGDEPYLVIFTSDHGEELDDHGLFGHGHTVFLEQLAVPFVVRFPHGRPGRETAPMSSLDLVPTVLELAGLDVPAHLPGRSLSASLPERRLLVAEYDGLSVAQLDGWKYLTGRAASYGWQHTDRSLFRSADDPLDAHDTLAEHADVGAQLERQLQDFHARHPPVRERVETAQRVDPAVVEQLEALGYLGDDG